VLPRAAVAGLSCLGGLAILVGAPLVLGLGIRERSCILDKGLFNRLEGELEARERSEGLKMSDLLELPEPLSSLLNWMMRKGQATLADVTVFLGEDEVHTRAILAGLRDRGFVREIEIHGLTQYCVRLAPKRGRALPSNLWQALAERIESEEERP
jgi:hypothetical protein